MKSALAAFAAAFSYFTVMPLGGAPRTAPDALGISFLPLVGAIVGLFGGSVGYGVWELTHAPFASAIAAWIACVAVTGAIHVDGFLDSCDALFVAATPERRLKIMRDPHHGTFAAVGMAMLALSWVAALAALDPLRLPVYLAFTGALGRASAILPAWIYPYARASEVTRAFERRPNLVVFVICAIAIGALGWWISPRVLAECAIGPIVALAIAWWSARRLGGGLVGDVYGAMVVVTEVVLLVALAPLMR